MFRRVVSNFRRKSKSSQKNLISSQADENSSRENRCETFSSAELSFDESFDAALSSCDSDNVERQCTKRCDKKFESETGANNK